MVEMIYLAEITAYDPGISGTRVLRYSTGRGFLTGPADTPANTLYEPRIVQPANFTRAAFSDARVMGGSTVGFGEMVLANADQGLAGFLNYGLDGRQCTVLVGPADGTYPGSFTTFLSGTIQKAEVGASKVTIRLRDNLMLLSVPIQTTTYLGNNSLPNGAEGTTDDIAGQPKPLTYGRVYHAPTVLVNTAALIYQVHDGAVQAIDSVFDGGVALTAGADYANLAALQLAGNQPAAGAYSTCLALGLLRLGATPGQRITAHVQGDNSGGYVNTVAGIVKRILTQRAGISAGALDASFAALDAAFTFECGIYIGQTASGLGAAVPASAPLAPVLVSQQSGGNTIQAAIDAVLLSAGAWLAPTRTGTWQIKQLLAPSGPPSASFTDVDIISLDSQTTADETAGIPIYWLAVRYKRYPGVLAASEVNGSVGSAAKADMTAEWRHQAATDSSVLTIHPLAPRLYCDTCLTIAANASAEAGRRLALHKVRRDFVKAELRLDATKAALDLGSVVQLTTSKLGYDAGRLFFVLGITSDGRKDELTLDLWG